LASKDTGYVTHQLCHYAENTSAYPTETHCLCQCPSFMQVISEVCDTLRIPMKIGSIPIFVRGTRPCHPTCSDDAAPRRTRIHARNSGCWLIVSNRDAVRCKSQLMESWRVTDARMKRHHSAAFRDFCASVRSLGDMLARTQQLHDEFLQLSMHRTSIIAPAPHTDSATDSRSASSPGPETSPTDDAHTAPATCTGIVAHMKEAMSHPLCESSVKRRLQRTVKMIEDAKSWFLPGTHLGELSALCQLQHCVSVTAHALVQSNDSVQDAIRLLQDETARGTLEVNLYAASRAADAQYGAVTDVTDSFGDTADIDKAHRKYTRGNRSEFAFPAGNQIGSSSSSCSSSSSSSISDNTHVDRVCAAALHADTVPGTAASAMDSAMRLRTLQTNETVGPSMMQRGVSASAPASATTHAARNPFLHQPAPVFQASRYAPLYAVSNSLQSHVAVRPVSAHPPMQPSAPAVPVASATLAAPAGPSAEVQERLKCAICQDYVTPNTDTSTTPCGHTFHLLCMSTMFRKNSTVKCPICRTIVEEITTVSSGSEE
jgi:hypothetical protein